MRSQKYWTQMMKTVKERVMSGSNNLKHHKFLLRMEKIKK